MGSFFTALSGLNADTTALDVVGNNLANMNTQGFKYSSVTFEDAMNQATASLQIGSGVATTNTNTNFNQGNIESTGQPLNLAIQGNGFFAVQDPSTNQIEYTRDGSFNLNSQGQLVTETGDLVQGWMAANGVVNPSGPTVGITVPLLTPLPPVPTANMSLTANLDASAPVGATFTAPVQVYDSLGNAITLSVAFTNTGPGAWDYSVNMPSSQLTGSTGATTALTNGSITFDSNGQLTSPAAWPARHDHQRSAFGGRRLHAQYQLESLRRQQQSRYHGLRPSLRHHGNDPGWFRRRDGDKHLDAERRNPDRHLFQRLAADPRAGRARECVESGFDDRHQQQ